jgi:hypothetical protein
MDPQRQAHEIYRTTTMIEFPWETRFGLNLAFYRPFAVPRIAALLEHTGEMARQPRKRAIDTGLWMYELIEHGFDHPRGREVVRGLNRMHHRFAIANEDYLYVLASFVVVPTRWIEYSGWRGTTAIEREATAVFYRELGRRMAITDLPANYEDFADYFDRYEDAHLAASPAGAAQMTATQSVIDEQLPRALRPLGAPAISVLLDTRLRAALGVPAPHPAMRWVIHGALAARAVVVRRRAPRAASWFEPGRTIRGLYPHGYQLGQLGPQAARGADAHDAD